MDLRRSFDAVLHCLILPLTAISFVLTPLTNDVRIFFGVEYIADKFYPFPYGWDLAWEIKPIGNRLVNWVMYKLASLFASINNPIWFGIAVKVFALAIVVMVSVYFAEAVKARYAFALTFLALIAVGNISVLQAEWWAVLLALVCVGLLLDDGWYNPIIVGTLFVGIGLLKGITVAMVIPITCAVYLLKDVKLSEKFGGMYIGVMFGLGVFAFFSLNVWPHMIPDMLMSAPVAYVGAIPLTTLLWFAVMGTPFSLAQMPVIAAGVVALLWFTITHWRRVSQILAALVMWAVPFATVVIQPELMIYHYYLLTIPALVTILMVEEGK